MVSHYCFQQCYQSETPAKEHWKENETQVIPEGAIAVFTGGSKGPRGTGAGIFFNGLLEDLYIPLGKYASVFQAETYAILLCASILKTLDLAQ